MRSVLVKAAGARRVGCLALLVPGLLTALLVVVALDGDSEASGGVPGVVCAPAGTGATRVGVYGPEQMRNAAVIAAVGRGRSLPEQAVVIALMAAMTESGLRNLHHGDRDSLGLFQMRPSQGWGTPAQVTDPAWASHKFYDVLLAVPAWQALPPGAAAQAVERSAHPDRYARHEQPAREVLGALDGVRCAPRSPGGGAHRAGNPRAQTVVDAALSQLGVPYAWAGGDPDGPTRGTGRDAGVTGFDCSGLALYAYAQAGIAVPHQTQAIWHRFQPALTDRAALRPGDLILLSATGRPGGIHHVGIYLGGGRVVHAPRSGDVVRVEERIWESPYWSREFIGAVRPGTA